MRLLFDRGTLVLEDTPPALDPATLPEVRWDPRVLRHRAPDHRAYAIASDLRRRGIARSNSGSRRTSRAWRRTGT